MPINTIAHGSVLDRPFPGAGAMGGRDGSKDQQRSGTATDHGLPPGIGDYLYTASAEADRKIVAVVAEIAKQRDLPRAQVALAWLLQKPGVTAPIIGVTKPHHLNDALAALELSLSEEEVAQMEAPYIPHPIVGFV